MPLVIDANIAIAWFRPVVSKLADAALDALCEKGAIVPALWRWEVQDVLRRLADSGHLTMSVDAALHKLRELPIDVDSEIAGLFGDELTIARTYGLTVYDSSYLELAVRRAIPLATIDKKLASAAKTAGAHFSFVAD